MSQFYSTFSLQPYIFYLLSELTSTLQLSLFLIIKIVTVSSYILQIRFYSL
jgi:hypothetical protein